MSIQLAVYFNTVKEINDNGIYKGALGPLVFQGGWSPLLGWNQEPWGRGLTKPMVLLVWVEGGCPSLQLILYTYLQCARGVSTVPRAAMTPVTRWRPQPSTSTALVLVPAEHDLAPQTSSSFQKEIQVGFLPSPSKPSSLVCRALSSSSQSFCTRVGRGGMCPSDKCFSSTQLSVHDSLYKLPTSRFSFFGEQRPE